MSTASKTYDLSTLYTTIFHNKLKTKFFYFIDSCFVNKNWKRKSSFCWTETLYLFWGSFGAMGGLLASELLLRGFRRSVLGAAICKIYGRYNSLVCPYNLSLSQMLSDMFRDNFWAVFEHWFWLQIAPFVMLARGGCVRSEGVLTPPWHLAPLLICPGVYVYRALIFVLLWGGGTAGLIAFVLFAFSWASIPI